MQEKSHPSQVNVSKSSKSSHMSLWYMNLSIFRLIQKSVVILQKNQTDLSSLLIIDVFVTKLLEIK